jgi:hypothetical protein
MAYEKQHFWNRIQALRNPWWIAEKSYRKLRFRILLLYLKDPTSSSTELATDLGAVHEKLIEKCFHNMPY